MDSKLKDNQIIKSIGKNSLIYGISTALQPLGGFILLPLFSEYFTRSDFGVYTIILLISTIFSTVFHLGINSAFTRSYFDYDKEEDRLKVFNTSLFILIIGFFLQILICVSISKYLSILILDDEKYVNFIIISVITSGINFINTSFFNYLRVREKALLYTIISSFSLILSVGLTCYFLEYLSKGISSPLYSLLITQSSILILLIFIHLKHINLFNINKKEIKILLQYGLPSIFAGIAIMIGEWGDKFLINKFLTVGELGVFSMAFKIALIYNLVVAAPFILVWSPLMMKLKDHLEIKIIFNRVTYLYFGVSIIFIFVMYLILDPMLSLIGFHRKFEESIPYVPLFMIAIALGSMQNIYAAGIIYARKPILLFYIYIFIGFANFICSYLSLINFGIIGVIVTFILFKLLTSLLVYYISSSYFAFKIFSLDYIKLLVVFSSTVIIYFKGIEGIFSPFVSILFLIVTILFLLYFLFRSEILGMMSSGKKKSFPHI